MQLTNWLVALVTLTPMKVISVTGNVIFIAINKNLAALNH
jgi:hypothetical protein